MKKRSLAKMFLLEIVTLGIYRLYYLIKTRREMMNQNPNIKIMSPIFLLLPFIIVFAGVAILLVASVYANVHNTPCIGAPALTAQDSNSTLASNCNSTPSLFVSLLPLLMILVFMVASLLFIVWEWSYSHGVEVITNNKLSFALSLIVLILVPDGFDILIIQDYFNKDEVQALTSSPGEPNPTPAA